MKGSVNRTKGAWSMVQMAQIIFVCFLLFQRGVSGKRRCNIAKANGPRIHPKGDKSQCGKGKENCLIPNSLRHIQSPLSIIQSPEIAMSLQKSPSAMAELRAPPNLYHFDCIPLLYPRPTLVYLIYSWTFLNP